MKLKQNEFCHNCQKYVDFEFDDVTERQVILCPNCGHEHWRELDQTTILNIQGFTGDRIRFAELPELELISIDESVPPQVCTIKMIEKKGNWKNNRR